MSSSTNYNSSLYNEENKIVFNGYVEMVVLCNETEKCNVSNSFLNRLYRKHLTFATKSGAHFPVCMRPGGNSHKALYAFLEELQFQILHHWTSIVARGWKFNVFAHATKEESIYLYLVAVDRSRVSQELPLLRLADSFCSMLQTESFADSILRSCCTTPAFRPVQPPSVSNVF